MTDRHKFALAALVIVSVVLGLGLITADHWVPVVQAIVAGAGA